MSEEPPKKLPKFSSLDELVSFFEEHDLGEYLDGMPEARFEVNLPKRVPIERGLYGRVAELAREKGCKPEELIGAWLNERLEAETTAR